MSKRAYDIKHNYLRTFFFNSSLILDINISSKIL